MTRGDRAVWRAAVQAALLAGAATLVVPVAAKPAGAPAFAPPGESPLLLSRKLVRELSGGTPIVATRRYRVTFHRDGEGWVVRGELVASEIDVPPALAAIAAIERNRPDDGLFPIHLDSSGLIVPAPEAPEMGASPLPPPSTWPDGVEEAPPPLLRGSSTRTPLRRAPPGEASPAGPRTCSSPMACTGPPNGSSGRPMAARGASRFRSKAIRPRGWR